MKKIVSFLFFLSAFASFSQMYVSSDTYMYANNAFVYVEQDVNLANTANVYLRNQSQLLQGTTGSSSNVGEGTLSVFQEGTTNNYQYNYWCSPVGVPNATSGNSNFGITLLNRPTTKTASIPATNSTAWDGSTSNSSLNISNKWIWKYYASNVYAPGTGGWVYVGAGTTVEPGLGFTMKGVSGTDTTVADPDEDANAAMAGLQTKQNNSGSNQRYDFRGKPNDGNMSATVSNNDGTSYINLTLVGNPYPSAINLNYYLLENSGYTIDYGTGVPTLTGTPQINNTAYFWEHDKSNATHNVGGYVGGYGTYVPNPLNANSPGTYTSAPMNTYSNDGETPTTGTASGNTFQRMFTPVGQGFMVHGAVASGTATMRNIYRAFVKDNDPAANYSQFEKTANFGTTLTNATNWDEIPNVAGVDYTQFSKLQAPQFKIHFFIDDTVVYESAAVFANNTSDSYDLFDGICPYGNVAKVACLNPIDGAEKLVVSTMPFAIDKKIPVTLKSDVASVYKIKVSELINFDLANEIYLHDKVNDIYYNILTDEAFVSLPAGENTTQFEIVFELNSVLNENNQEIANSFLVYQNNGAGLLTLINPLNEDVAEASVYDVLGKKVIAKQSLGTANQIEIPTGSLNNGVYIVKVKTSQGLSFTKKVLVK
ncbi:T9SS type A sorting domain-containing protein [Flavobacterium sp.]|uniref:T9SS type A sorting domain-containing protein n=1 Tax=Flavobacterium sp. TaxID=239 RepID=UPI0035270C91